MHRTIARLYGDVQIAMVVLNVRNTKYIHIWIHIFRLFWGGVPQYFFFFLFLINWLLQWCSDLQFSHWKRIIIFFSRNCLSKYLIQSYLASFANHSRFNHWLKDLRYWASQPFYQALSFKLWNIITTFEDIKIVWTCFTNVKISKD